MSSQPHTGQSGVYPPAGGRMSRLAWIAQDLQPERKQPKQAFTPKGFSLDSLAALNVFIRAAESCSFTDVGQQLGPSSSAIGKCIVRLEQRLGVRLFHRNARCINLRCG